MQLRRLAQRCFSTLNASPKGSYNLMGHWNRIKSAVRAPIKHLKRNLEPSGTDNPTMPNTTEEAFDEVSQEWQALVVANPYDVNIMNMLEAVVQNNFGTVDNPHVVFTSEAPFRYVGCTGFPNEDDLEGHEFLVFMLREGPLQRCPSCGQVYKLVRLRNEFSTEMDYYLSGFVPYDMQEMGDMDNAINMSILRMQKDSYEYSQFEVPSHQVYNLVNSDEHDRLLTDPAYRLEKSKILEEKYRVYTYSLREIEKEFVQNFGPLPRFPMQKVDYESLVAAEVAIRRLDRIFERVAKFHSRQFVDRANHERREKRMQERSKGRWEGSYTLFSGGLTEEEQKYRDYFETDLELRPEDEALETQFDVDRILTSSEYKLDKYDFQERYTKAYVEEDATSIAEKKAFKFRYRQANDTLETFQRREERLLNRQLQRGATSKINDYLEEYNQTRLSGDKPNAQRALTRYHEAVRHEALQSYKDYFESDGEEDWNLINNLSEKDKDSFVKVLESQASPRLDNKLAITLRKRPWDTSLGIWANFMNEISDHAGAIIPLGQQYIIEAETLSIHTPTKQDLLSNNVVPEHLLEGVAATEPKKIEDKPRKSIF
jgi:ssDNA-binding Zn-finger/Zn-ribbon topoisomerase 1